MSTSAHEVLPRRIEPLREAKRKRRADRDKMTTERLQVLEGLCSGLCGKLIARKFGVTYSTIKHHSQWLMRHAGATSQAQLGVWAAKRGLV